MRGVFTSRLLVVLGVLVCLYLGYEVGRQYVGGESTADDAAEPEYDALTTLQDELFDELQEGATLSRMPGWEGRRRGTGLLKGIVRLQADGAPRPMPGVEVRLIGHDGEKPLTHPPAVTDVEGAFLFPKVPAHVGYVLLVDQPPYRRVTLRGNVVYADKATDVGVILLGAPTSLKGQVLDAKGRPIVGAQVRVLRDGGRQRSFDAGRAISALQSTLNYLAESRVGGDGHFVVEALSPGRYVLRISAPGYATQFKSGVLVTVDERSSTVRVVLDTGVGFEGKVVDETGRGLADARVIAAAIPSANGGKRLDRFEVRSAADGSYRLDTLISGMTYLIDTWAEGFAPTAALLATGSGVQKRDFQLLPSGRIEGRLVDAVTGQGIPAAEVVVFVGGLTKFSPVSATTDEAGGFMMAHVLPGPVFMFTATAVGYQPSPMFDFKSVRGLQVVGGDTTWIDWSLQAGGSVFGRVTASGQPVAYAEIALVDRKRSRQQWTGELTAMTDVEGAYELFGVAEGKYDIHVRGVGHAPPSDPAQTLVEMRADLQPIQKNVMLVRGATVRGTVKGPNGEAVRGARVFLAPARPGTNADVLRDLIAVTGASGAYTITGVPAGIEVLITAEHDAWVRSAAVRATLTPGQDQSFPLTLRSGVVLEGRVQDERGGGIADARVRWGNVDGVPERDLRDSFRADAHLTSRVLRTDGDGAFQITGLPPGRLLLKVEMDGYAAWYQRDVLIVAEGVQPTLTAALVATMEIRGRVTSSATGRPLTGAFVVAEERGPPEGAEADPGRVRAVVSAETGADGTYVLEKVPPGTHRIVVWFGPPGYAGQVQGAPKEKVRRDGVAAGARGVDFVLDPLLLPDQPGASGVDDEGKR